MQYEDLRAIQRKERNTQKLAEIDADFCEKLSFLIAATKTKCDSTHDACELKNLDNALKVAKDIFERREQKIVLKALRDYKISDISDEGLLPYERDFYDKIVQGLKKHKDYFDQILLGQATIACKEPEKTAEQPEALNMQLIRITNQVPKILSKNMAEIGPFEPTQLVKLSEEDAQLLVSKNLAEKV